MGRRIIIFLILIVIILMIGTSVWKYVVNKDESNNSSDNSGNALDIKDTVDNANRAKKNAFVVETQSIYKQVTIDFVNDSLLSGGTKYYCQQGPQTDYINYDVTDCKPLNFNTNFGYYSIVNNSGKIELIVVYNDMFYYTAKPSESNMSVADIRVDGIGEIKNLSSSNILTVSTGKIGN